MDQSTEESPRSASSDQRPDSTGSIAPRRWQSVKASVLVLMSVGLVPAVAFTAWHLTEQREQALQQAYSRAELLNNGVSANLGRILTDAKAVMSAVSTRPKVAALKSGDCDPVFRDFGSVYPNYTLLVLIRADGETLCPNLGQNKPAANGVKQHRSFRDGLARSAFYAGDAVVAPVSRKWVAPLMYPINDRNGRLRGVLVLPLDLEKLGKELFSALSKDDSATVIDGSGQVLLRNSQLSQRIGRPIAGPLAEALARMKADQSTLSADSVVAGRLSARGLDGVERLYFARSLPMSQWWVVTGVPEEETLRGYVKLRNRSIAAMTLVLALAALIGWRVARRVMRPLNDLTLAAKNIAAGYEGYRARESGPGELGVVAREFNRMLDAQRAVQHQLRDSELQYRALFHAAPVPSVILTVPERRVMDLNDAACEFFGVTRELILGRIPEEAGVGPLERDKVRFYEELEARQRVSGLAGQMRVRSGEWREVLLNAEFIQYSGQRCVLAMSLDLTNLRQAEKSRAELAAARAADHAKTEFLSRMSHELRTPLNAVLGFTQILQMDRRLPADVQERVGHILTAGRHLLSLVEELLDLSRIESGNLALTLLPVNLRLLLGECLSLCQPLATAKEVRLSASDDQVDPPRRGDLWVRADQTRLRQILMNLLSNAIKYNRAGGTVTLKIESALDDTPEAEVHLTIIDTGRGMNEQQMERLFVPFNRLGAEFGAVEGHGIGLVIARRLAQAMNGDITVRSTPGKGSEFTVHLKACIALPETVAEPPRIAPPPEPSPLARSGGDASQRLRVLSVEDNAVNQAVVQALFAQRRNLELVTAADGATALMMARTKRPDLILMDLNLPDINGFELLKQLRSDAATTGIPCWAVTADAMRETLGRVRAAGFEAHVSKPFATEDLLNRIDQWTRCAEAAAEKDRSS